MEELRKLSYEPPWRDFSDCDSAEEDDSSDEEATVLSQFLPKCLSDLNCIEQKFPPESQNSKCDDGEDDDDCCEDDDCGWETVLAPVKNNKDASTSSSESEDESCSPSSGYSSCKLKISSKSLLQKIASGTKWKSRLYLYDQHDGPPEGFDHDELSLLMESPFYSDKKDPLRYTFTAYYTLCNSEENFEKKSEVFQEFMVFRTSRFWYSLEKNPAGIVVQRSSQYNNVFHYVGSVKRKKPKTDEGSLIEFTENSNPFTMQDIFKWIHETEQLSKPYNLEIEDDHIFNCALMKIFI